MPEKQTVRKAAQDRREGKSPSTQAGEFVREEIDQIRKGKHGARSPQQAIAIGLSKARRAGVKLPVPPADRASKETRRKAERDLATGAEHPRSKVNERRSRGAERALQQEGTAAAAHENLSRQARQVASRKSPEERSEIGRKAARTRQAHKSQARGRAPARHGSRPHTSRYR